MRELEFQSLIGRLTTFENYGIEDPLTEFQSLIGRLTTSGMMASGCGTMAFQSLIGRLTTKERALFCPDKQGFNPS